MAARIDELMAAHSGDAPWVAFEYYPPRTEDGVNNLKKKMPRFKAQKPLYIDMTFGAGGSTSDLTLDLCKEAKAAGLEPNMHLTCTNMPQEKIYEALEGAKAAGIRNIVALRGDPPLGQERWEAVEGGFTCALDLTKHIVKTYGKDQFCISTAGYPEGHPGAIKKVAEGQELSDKEKRRVVSLEDGDYVCSDADFAKEMEYLKAKVDAGASLIITQMFFDVDVFADFLEACKEYGITVPVIPGLMLVQNAGGFGRMTAFCKTRVPTSIREGLEAVKEDDAAVKQFGIDLGAKMCEQLMALGCKGLHFYTLNLEKVTFGVMRKLGLFDEDAAAAAAAAAEPAAAASAGAASA
ncbi:hypothetical protein FNF29_04982 [Cafeteria roenbergensis]|uniref:Uncharacterized protein n=1 Tax=Cafeteria roenbergensis TaxID=33653 RepID=A0A5A8CD90_CAFRO|nr:hypothetical protein FNF29_04982 [Cafeteria roenbergensis]|eukprot:KAA0150868.1 hypothetical protein FNF29_04982 [Cafeteria roenbergensis]